MIPGERPQDGDGRDAVIIQRNDVRVAFATGSCLSGFVDLDHGVIIGAESGQGCDVLPLPVTPFGNNLDLC